VLKTLVQFYDPRYHCFTFPDYQLVPTLEEYSYLMGRPVLEEVPFSGLKETLIASAIAKALDLKTSEIAASITPKAKIQGLTSKFLLSKAYTCASTNQTHAFESILALVIYGLVLFPNINGFVDANGIQIFLTKNPVSTLLADTYHSIHHKTMKQDGTILCCAPLLYKWYTMHLPQSYLSKEKGICSEKIMALTPAEIVWYIPAYDFGTIIDSCGEFNNVPLIGVHGGINYNPILARCQFKYPVEGKPRDIVLERVFYHNHDDNQGMRQRFAEAWKTIHKKDNNQLGKKSDFVHEAYTQWIIDRAMSYGLPYTLPRLLTSTTPEIPLPLLPQTKEEYQRRLHEANRESAGWKVKY